MVVRDPALPVHPVRARIAFFLTLPLVLWKLRLLLARHRILTINCIFPGTDSLTYVLLRRFRLFSGKVIFTLQGNDIKVALDTAGFSRFLARQAFRLADRIVACSFGLREDLLRLEPQCANKSVVIHNSIDFEAFLALAPPDYQLPDNLRNVPFLLNVGRYEHKKGQDILICAFEQIALDFPSLHLVMIGATGTGIEQIRRKVCGSSFTERIVMLENIPHEAIPVFLRAALLFVLPSRREGLPFALLEAAACRKAVVAAACVGVPELIQDGVTGRLVPVDNSDALALAISDLLRNDHLREQFAETLHELVGREFTWQAAFRKYINL
jgi:starch synthase